MNPRLPFVLLGCLALPALLPASLVTDRKMETAVRGSYVYRVVLQDRVRANAEFGVLTLTGSVEDLADRMLAEDTARSVAWVGDVTNKVTLLPSHGEQSDAWLALRVLADLRRRTGVNADTTRVAAAEGVVTLTGTVRDDRQKERTAMVAAGIAGVKQVQNNLAVQPPAAGEEFLSELIDDASIRGLIVGALRAQGLDVAAIKVSVVEGAVRLTGEVESEAAKEEVTRLVREARGTRFVTNMLKARR
jgi:osmotically-inducible protein OsmY